MKRLLVHVEGQTEEEFTNQVLCAHLATAGFASTSARLLGSRRERAGRGGVRRWAGVKREIERHLLQDREVFAALLVDYYGLPNDWPGREAAERLPVDERSAHLASALRGDLSLELQSRFFPCVLMHEFEAMVFVDAAASANAWGRPKLEPAIRAVRGSFRSVEHINDSPETAPSKRLLAIDPQYEKPVQGILAVLSIGLTRIRAECPSLDHWLVELERS